MLDLPRRPRIIIQLTDHDYATNGSYHGPNTKTESFKIFGIGKEDGKKIIHRLGHTLLNEYEKFFGSY